MLHRQNGPNFIQQISCYVKVCLASLVFVDFGSKRTASRISCYTLENEEIVRTFIRCIGSWSESFLAFHVAVSEVYQSVRSYVTDICALHRLMQRKLCLAFLRIFRRIFHLLSFISSKTKLRSIDWHSNILRQNKPTWISRIDFAFRLQNILSVYTIHNHIPYTTT